MNKTILVVGIVILIIVIGGAYWVFGMNGLSSLSSNLPSGTSEVTPGPANDPGPVGGNSESPAVVAARKDLATKLAVSEGTIDLIKVEEKTWTDGCLGLARLDELCTEALVDGYRVEMQVGGKTYVYRTNKTGTSVRAEAQ